MRDMEANSYAILSSLCGACLPMATQFAEQAFQSAQGTDAKTMAHALCAKGGALFYSQKFAEAHRAYSDSREQYIQSGDTRHVVMTMGNLAACAHRLGNSDNPPCQHP